MKKLSHGYRTLGKRKSGLIQPRRTLIRRCSVKAVYFSPMSRIALLLSFFFMLFSVGLHAQQYRFIENKGQWHPNVEYRAEVPGAYLYLEANTITYDLVQTGDLEHIHATHHGLKVKKKVDNTLHKHAIKQHFIGADPSVQIIALDHSPHYFNYCVGSPDRWAKKARATSGVHYTELYPGIDLRIQSQGHIKYDLIVAAGADPAQIHSYYEGAKGLILKEGALVVKNSVSDFMEQKPFAYQVIAGDTVEVACHFVVDGLEVSFDIDEWNQTHELVIDPVLIFSTYSGSFSDNFGYTATFDGDGFLYSGSSAFGNQYPTTAGAYQQTHAGGDGLGSGIDMAITKYDTTGTFMVWSTFLGGSNDELPHSLIANSLDEIFVYGTSSSPDFPTSTNAFDGSYNGGSNISLTGLGANYVNGSDIVVARLSNDGSALLASTFIGGSLDDGLNLSTSLKFNYADEIRGEVLLDENNNVYVVSTTSSQDMPTTAGSFQPNFAGGSFDGCVFKLDNDLTTVIWGSYFGGGGADAAYSVDLDANNNIYIAGGTTSPDLITTPGVLGPGNSGGLADGFVAHISEDGSSILNASYWGTSAYDQTYFVELDKDQNVHLFGQTQGPANDMIFNAAYNQPNSGQFITKMTPDLSALIWSTRLGTGNGTPNISPTAFLVDVCKKIYISGWGSNVQGSSLSVTGLEVTSDAHQGTTTGNDFYLMVLEDDASNIFYGTYFGGNISAEHVDGGTSRFDRKGRVYQSVCAGCGGNSDFPIEPNPGAHSATNNSTNCNNGVFKFDFQLPIVIADFDAQANCLPDPVQFENESSGATDYFWDFGDNTNSTQSNPSHQYSSSGVYDVMLVANNSATCNFSDTAYTQVVVLANTVFELDDVAICLGETEQIGLLPIPDTSITYLWIPDDGLSSATVSNPFASPGSTTEYALLISNGICTDTATQVVSVGVPEVEIVPDTTICAGESVELTANGNGNVDEFLWSSNPNFTDTLNTWPMDSSITVSPTVNSTYYLSIGSNGCISSTSVNVNIALIDAAISPAAFICFGDTVQLSVTGFDSGSSITWQPSSGILAGQNSPIATVSPESTTTYTAIVTSPEGCTWSGTATVSVSDINPNTVQASADPTAIQPGESSQLNVTPSSGVNYDWSPGATLSDSTISNPVATPEVTTTYFVTVSDGICTRSDSVTVVVHELNCEEPDIFVPSGFSPNGDGTNDVLYVRGMHITELVFKVFDRWGEKVFETTSLDHGWDGYYKGKLVEPAVFVYYLDAKCVDGQDFFKKGNVSVLQ